MSSSVRQLLSDIGQQAILLMLNMQCNLKDRPGLVIVHTLRMTSRSMGCSSFEGANVLVLLPAAGALGGGCGCCAVTGSNMLPTASISSSKILPNIALLA